MKKTLALMVSTFVMTFASLSASAHEGGSFGKIVCIQNTEYSPIKGEKITVLLNQIQNTRNYQLSVMQKQLGGTWSVILTDILRVTTEDVMAHFKAKGSRTSMMIYLDELNQSTLTLAAPAGDVTMVCRTNR